MLEKGSKKKKKNRKPKTPQKSEESAEGVVRDRMQDAMAGALVDHFPSPSPHADESGETKRQDEGGGERLGEGERLVDLGSAFFLVY